MMEKTDSPVACLVCGVTLTIRTARGRKSGKPFVMLICPDDGRHFRAFVSDQEFVKGVLNRAGDPSHENV